MASERNPINPVFGERRKSKLKRKLYSLVLWGLIDLDFRTLTRRILQLEILSIGGIILMSWVNEIYGLPHILYDAPRNQPNYYECSLETAWALLVLVFMLAITKSFLKQVKHLEGFLPVCSFCKSIRVEEAWEPVERFIHQRTEVKMTHSLCPSCAREHYGLTDEQISNFKG